MRHASRVARAAAKSRTQAAAAWSNLTVETPSCSRHHHHRDSCPQRDSTFAPETFAVTSGRLGIGRNDLKALTRFYSSQANSLPLNATEDGQRTSSSGGPLSAYERQIASGHLKAGDKHQENTLRALQTLYDRLHDVSEEAKLDRNSHTRAGSSGSWFSFFLPKVQWNSRAALRGLYMYGGVGTGKTMLMDMFFEELPATWRKKRIHFHDFMLDVHSQLRKVSNLGDPLGVVAETMANDAILLCIDEFMVTDVADALILNRLFDHLFRRGIILVSTSNRHPDHLYEGGLQRDLFLPFIANLKAHCVVHEIGSGTDYRRLTVAQQGTYFIGPSSAEYLHEKFNVIVNGQDPKPTTVELRMGRTLEVPLAAAGCAYFQFHELCEMPLGAADYFGLFKVFHTLALEGVPNFGSHNRASAYRFVTLIDVLYEHKARFICSAEGTPSELFAKVTTFAAAPRKSSARSSRHEDADLLVDNELGFAKDRTMSRLTEINSSEYLEEHEAAHGTSHSQQKIWTTTGTTEQ